MKCFNYGLWRHNAPHKEFDSEGRKAIISNVCFGPMETLTYGVTRDCKYYYRYEILEPEAFQDVFFEYITKEEILKAIDNEIQLCRKCNAEELIALFEYEKQNII